MIIKGKKRRKNSTNFNSKSFVQVFICCACMRLYVVVIVAVVMVVVVVVDVTFSRFFWIAAVNVCDVSELSHHYRCCMRSSAVRVIIVAKFFFRSFVRICFFPFYCFIFFVRSLFIWSFSWFALLVAFFLHSSNIYYRISCCNMYIEFAASTLTQRA